MTGGRRSKDKHFCSCGYSGFYQHGHHYIHNKQLSHSGRHNYIFTFWHMHTTFTKNHCTALFSVWSTSMFCYSFVLHELTWHRMKQIKHIISLYSWHWPLQGSDERVSQAKNCLASIAKGEAVHFCPPEVIYCWRVQRWMGSA